MKQIARNLVHFCTQKPKTVYAIVLFLTLVFALQIPRIQIDTDPENMLDAAHPARLFHNQVKQQFAMHDAIVVGVVNETEKQGVFPPATLTDIYDITQSIMAIDGVISADLMSISTVDNITQRLMYRALQQTLTLNAFNFYSTSDHDGYLKLSADYSPTDKWRLSGGLNLFYGDVKHTFFSQFEDASNGFVRFRLFY